jgi:hypothetical protein
LTTLLLDDSPLKATLQPYNHVCIHEYDSSLRANDLQIFERRLKADREGKALQISREKIKRKRERQKKWEEERIGELLNGEDIRELLNGDIGGKRKKKRKEKISEEQLAGYPGQLDITESLSTPQSPHPEADNGRVLDPRDRDPGDAADDSARPSTKRKRHDEVQDAALENPLEDTEPVEHADSPSEPKSPQLQSDNKQKFDQTLLAVIGVLNALKSESNVAGWIRSGKLWSSSSSAAVQDEATPDNDSGVRDEHTAKKQKKREASVELETGADDNEGDAALWFTHTPTMEHWAGKGKETLVALGISLNDGVLR